MQCGAKLFNAPLGVKPVMTLLGSVQTTTLVVVMIGGLKPNKPPVLPGEIKNFSM